MGVQGCDIAQRPKAQGLYHIRGHPPQVLYFVYKTVSVYYIYDILHNDGIISAHKVYIQYIYPTTSKG